MKVQDIDKLIGKNLRRIRNSKGLSQEQLGQLIHNPPTKISALENGKEGMGKDLMTKICTALNVRPAEFYIEPETPIITDDKEKLHLQKFRKAKALNIDREIDLFTQWTIDKALHEKSKSSTATNKRKQKKVSENKV